MNTAFITGGSSDIGRAITKSLVEHGWEVIAPDHRELDLSKLDTIREKTERATKDAVTLEAVIHAASIWHDEEQLHRKDLEDYTEQQIADVMNVGLTGFMVCLTSLLPKMPKTGAVIGISGTFAGGASGWLPYYTGKRGLEDFLVGLAKDYPSGPRVFGISPADTATKAYKRFFPEDAANAQPPDVIAHAIHSLLTKPIVATGTILDVRGSAVSPGYHQ